MNIIWWTLYILGALTICILWTQLMALIGTWLKAYRDKRETLPLTRKDIQSLVRMEVQAALSNIEISRTIYPGLGKDSFRITTKDEALLRDHIRNDFDKEKK